MRIDVDEFEKLGINKINQWSDLYHCTNVILLKKWNEIHIETIIQQMIEIYQPRNNEERKNAIKEVMQEIVFQRI